MWLNVDHVTEFDTKAKFSYCMRNSVIEAGAEVYQSNPNAIVFSDEVLQTAKPEIALSGEAKEIVSNYDSGCTWQHECKRSGRYCTESMLKYQEANGARFAAEIAGKADIAGN